MIDAEGYRPNVGMIVVNDDIEVLWAKRLGQGGFQFPQGGIKEHETPEQALYRELEEELGLVEKDVSIIGVTAGWLKYRLPEQYLRQDNDRGFVGQKQKWFLLRLTEDESKIDLAKSGSPEFDDFTWVAYWYPIDHIIEFKKSVYERALQELAPVAETFYGRKIPR